MPTLEDLRDRLRPAKSLATSTSMVTRALTRPWRRTPGPRRLLEVGPRTGKLTHSILRQLRPGDELTLVEKNTNSVEELHVRFQSDPEWQPYYQRTKIIHAPLQNVGAMAPFDFIISHVPLYCVPPVVIEQIFATFERLLKSNGILSYLDIPGLPEIQSFWASATTSLQLEFSKLLLQRKRRRYQLEEDWVYLNFPPVIVRHLSFQTPERKSGEPKYGGK